MLSWEFDRYNIVEGENFLWNGVSKPYRETIRSFLAYFQNQVNNLRSAWFSINKFVANSLLDNLVKRHAHAQIFPFIAQFLGLLLLPIIVTCLLYLIRFFFSLIVYYITLCSTGTLKYFYITIGEVEDIHTRCVVFGGELFNKIW